MRFVLFYHSFTSCWNHGNVHFLRGVTRALIARGHQVTIYEPADSWSRVNALREPHGAAILEECAQLVPGADIRSYTLSTIDLDRALDGADVVIVHEWNDPMLLRRIADRRVRGGRFLLLFHDTHHRAASGPHELNRLRLDACDLVLVFGEVLRQRYLANGWGRKVATWHEAADTDLFSPQPNVTREADLVWIGNWGDDERDRELTEFLARPVAASGLQGRLYGVRYPLPVLARLPYIGLDYRGWLPNHRAPRAFAAARFTVHVPRRPYVEALPGIPTIRVFEALACGTPLICAPWPDVEGLFPEGCYLKVKDGAAMLRAMRIVMHDGDLTAEMVRRGRAVIASRHSCTHRADELLALLSRQLPNRQRKPRDVIESAVVS
ncbi:MAG TPA: glycosyltransferase [Xanthobacteraceae bacterium]|nr:glycosyltransferase [Xanthobacteraceae bacterium]